MKAYGALVRANMLMLLRARDALFWTFAFPIVFMILLGTAFGQSPAFSAHVGVTGHGIAQQALIQALHHVPGMKVSIMSQTSGLTALKSGKIALFVEISGRHLTLVRTNAPTSETALSILQGVITRMNLEALHAPLIFQATVHHIYVQGTSYIDFLAPGILGMTLMNTGLFAGTSLITYRSQGILRRIRGTPLSTSIFIAARMTTQLIIAMAQAFLILGVAELLYQFKPVGNLWAMIPFLILGELAFMSVGFFIAGIASTMELASALTNIVSLPMMFLAGVFYPVSQLPSFVRPLANILPLRFLTHALRGVVLYGTPLSHLGSDLMALALTGFIGGALAVKFFRWETPHV
ncbi:ABC transporter permease [Sulfobacillus thermosulfidooxidans]|uniref:ABC transporter permease n=1 Tax=Sulfobacillus thermosulfidooxidans TaxID=28034 RepID=UPI0006B5540A|nr:ABC transporter permease [Sulfobacillus thermosulfidooxidans]